METHPTPRASRKAEQFTESVIREMTRLCMEVNGINLAQGFPDFPAPEEVKEAAIEAVRGDVNQYAVTWGAHALREALAAKMERDYGLAVDPDTEITVTCGSTEAMISTLLATIDPGDEVVIFEPFYENYGPDAVLAGATPRYVTLRPPEWTFDAGELENAFGPQTRALILNSPNNPTGKVFTPEELEAIASLCRRWNVLVVTDEIYEHIVYDGARHVPMATLPGMRERTVTISALSKTFSVTGWRVGWAVASPEVTAAVRKVHDFLTVGAPAPLQEAGAVALRLGPDYYAALARDYRRRRDVLLGALEAAGFRCNRPRGAYYVMADLDAFEHEGDVAFSQRLVRETGVAVVPGSSFYHDGALGRNQVRFCFCKTLETLRRAGARLGKSGPAKKAPGA